MSTTPDPSEPPPRRAQIEVTMASTTVLRVFLLAVGVFLLILLGNTLVAFFLAAFLACGLHPAVVWLQGRTNLGRGAASLLLFALAALAVLLVSLVVVIPVYGEFRSFVDELPSYIAEIKTTGIGEQIEKLFGISGDATQAAKELAKAMPDAASAVLGIGGSLVSGLFAVITITFLTLYLLIELPTVMRTISSLLTPGAAEVYERMQLRVNDTIGRSLLGQLCIATIAGIVAGLASWAIGLPFPVVLGVIVAAFDLVPQVGSTIAGIILGLVALTVSVPATIAIVAVIVVYQQVENYLIQPAVMKQAVEISPLVTIASVIAGAALFGILGAILAVPVAASTKVVLTEVLAPRRARMAALREEAAATEATAAGEAT